MTLGTCVLTPTPRAATACTGQLVVSSPRMNTCPSVGRRRPVTQRKNVLFPAPLGPIRQRSSLSFRVKSTWSTATTPPKRTVSPTVSRTVSAMSAQ